MKLDLSSLNRAISSLERSLKVAADSAFMAGLDADPKDAIRAGVIQNFKVGFILCWKFMQRWLKENAGSGEILSTRKELFRTAARHGLIADPTAWFAYGDARNLTTHTYNAETAESVYETARTFIADAKSFRDRLEQFNND
jgi:nucleotidyltransferase substrate binding protein (TIGR01987 family)